MNKKEKSHKESILSILLTSAVFAALVTGIFSLIVSYDTNERLKYIETQKHHYDLQETRYEKLQDALEYFSIFKVYDPKFIYRFDISSDDYSIVGAMDMYYDSSQEFLSQVYLVIPYLSDDAIAILEESNFFKGNALDIYDIDVGELTDDAKINTAVKNHLELVNSEFESETAIVMQALTHDIALHYIYLQP